MKITVVGAGNVGATCADVLASREIANEVVDQGRYQEGQKCLKKKSLRFWPGIPEKLSAHKGLISKP